MPDRRNPFAILYLNCSVSDSFSVRAQDEFAYKFNNIFSRFYCRFKNYWHEQPACVFAGPSNKTSW